MMKCDECGGQLAVKRNAVRRYSIGGLPHIELHGVEVTTCNKCGQESIAVPRVGQLHKVLAASILRLHRKLAPTEVRFLRKHIGLSGNEFAQRMGVTRETISRWENGNLSISALADRLVRLLVVSHKPSEDYAVDDMLSQLTDKPAPKKLSSVPLWSGDKGWTPEKQSSLALA